MGSRALRRLSLPTSHHRMARYSECAAIVSPTRRFSAKAPRPARDGWLRPRPAFGSLPRQWDISPARALDVTSPVRGWILQCRFEISGIWRDLRAGGSNWLCATSERAHAPAGLRTHSKRHVAEVTADGNRLRVKVTLRGKPHVDLDMARVRDDKVIANFRNDQERARELPGGSALQQFFGRRGDKKG
jgi:hypothetical protein